MNQATEVVVYEPNETTLVATVEKLRGLKISGVDDKKGYALVHEGRMELRGFRVKIEKDRKQLTADALEWQRKVNAEAKRLTGLIEPTERELEAEEDRIDAEKKRIAEEEETARRKVLDDRMAALASVGSTLPPSQVQDMGENEFAAVYSDAAIEHDKRREIERLAAEEKARIAAEEAAARKTEQERQDAEREFAESERKRRIAEEDRAREEQNKVLAAERAELDRQKAAQRAEEQRLAQERAAFEAQRAEAARLAEPPKVEQEVEAVASPAAPVRDIQAEPDATAWTEFQIDAALEVFSICRGDFDTGPGRASPTMHALCTKLVECAPLFIGGAP